MNAFLNSLKADLLDRRLRAVLLAIGAGLVAAVVYALTGGSGATPAPVAAVSPPPSGTAITAVAAPTNGKQAVAETTDGTSLQHEGKARNPFTALPGAKSAATASTAQSASSHSSSKGSAGASNGAAQKRSEPSHGSSGGTPAKRGKPAPSNHKAKTAYHVAILFGPLPAGTPAQNAHLTPYTNLKLGQKLGPAKTPLLSFHGVTAGGKRVVFELLGEAFLKGSASCLPSPTQCQSIGLAKGQSEQLEYVPAEGGHPVVYELQVVSITKNKAAAARARISLLRRVRALEARALTVPVVTSE
jgi:hypothetical protein